MATTTHPRFSESIQLNTTTFFSLSMDETIKAQSSEKPNYVHKSLFFIANNIWKLGCSFSCRFHDDVSFPALVPFADCSIVSKNHDNTPLSLFVHLSLSKSWWSYCFQRCQRSNLAPFQRYNSCFWMDGYRGGGLTIFKNGTLYPTSKTLGPCLRRYSVPHRVFGGTYGKAGERSRLRFL